MPTVDKLVAATKGLKVKEVPQAVGKFVGEHVPDLDRRARPDVRSLARPPARSRSLSLALPLGSFARHYTPDKTSSRLVGWCHNYKAKHNDSGSPKPLFDVLGYGFVFAYALAWPQEYAHYKHEQEAKLKAGGGH